MKAAGGSIHRGDEKEGGSDDATDVPGVIRIMNEDYFMEHEDEDCLIPLDTYCSAFVYRCIGNGNKGLPMPHPWKYL